MNFKGWVLTEALQIQWQRDIASLVPSPEAQNKEFHYQWPQGYSTFYIGGFTARREGYVAIGNRPTHLGIIKTDAIDANQGIDIGFIKNLIALLQQNGMKSIPYREEGSDFDPLFKQVQQQMGNEAPELDPVKTGWQTGQDAPDIELGASNAHQLTRGMSVSRASGSWAQFFEYSEINWIIPRVIEIMKKAAQPLLDNDLIDHYEVIDRKSNQQSEIVYSARGKQESDDWKTQNSKAASQIKYLANALLVNYPLFKDKVLRTVGADDIKGGGQGWFGHDAQPQNFHVPLETLYKVNQNSFSEDIVIKIFLDAVKTNDATKFQQLEQLAHWSQAKQKTNQNLNFFGGAAEKLSWFWEDDSMLQDCIDKPLYYLSAIYDVVKYGDILQKLEPEEYDYWKKQIKDKIEEDLGERPQIRPNDVYYLTQMAGPLGFNPALIAQLDQQDQEVKTQKAAQEKQRQEAQLKRSFLMDYDAIAYMMLNEGRWKPVPSKFLSYYGGKDEPNIGELAMELIDTDGIRDDAYSAAAEDAQGEVQERPSESYGNDTKEVEGDIDYDWDDFLNAVETEIDEDTPEEEAVRLIKDKYLQDFIDWKKEQMREDEEGKDSWKYEPDTESHEFQQKMWDYEKEFAEKAAWEEGLIVLTSDKHINIQLDAKYWEKFKPILKRTIDANFHTKNDDEEPYWKASTKIEVEFMSEKYPQGNWTKSAYDWYREL